MHQKLTTIRPQDIIIERGTEYDTDAIGDIMLKSKIYGDTAYRKNHHICSKHRIIGVVRGFGCCSLDGNTPQSVRPGALYRTLGPVK